MTTFAEIVVEARRRNPDWTDAEWDYSLAAPDGRRDGIAELWHAAYIVANQHLPQVTPDGPSDLAQRQINRANADRSHTPERDALIAAAKAKTYTGWSDAARGQGKRIEYAR